MPSPQSREFHARLERTAANIYRASYRGDLNPDQAGDGVMAEGAEVMPDTHIGTDPEAVKSFVESLARQHGYDRVVWEEPR